MIKEAKKRPSTPFYYYLGETDLLWSPLHCIIDNVDAYKCLVNQHLVLLILVDIAERWHWYCGSWTSWIVDIGDTDIVDHGHTLVDIVDKDIVDRHSGLWISWIRILWIMDIVDRGYQHLICGKKRTCHLSITLALPFLSNHWFYQISQPISNRYQTQWNFAKTFQNIDATVTRKQSLDRLVNCFLFPIPSIERYEGDPSKPQRNSRIPATK